MSHLTSTLAPIVDLDCVKTALPKFPKLSLVENVDTYEYFGDFLDDWGKDNEHRTARSRGVDPSKYGKCDHKLVMAGCKYEIGLTKRDDGNGWSLVWDAWASGHAISNYIGESGEKFMSEYQRAYCEKYGLECGCLSTFTETEDSIVVRLDHL